MVDIILPQLGIQLANFLVLVFILNQLLLKPILKHMAERDGEISSSHEKAKESADKAEGLLVSFEQEMAQARTKANASYMTARQDAVAAQREKLAVAKAEAQKMLDAARAEISRDADQARVILSKEMARLPKDIASKLLGRAV